mgnify:CR=1 FL=1
MEEKKQQSISLVNREYIEIDGILNVKKFEEQEIILETELGTLNIKGEGMHMEKLDLEKGEISIQGSFDSIAYMDDGFKSGGFFSRLFK